MQNRITKNTLILIIVVVVTFLAGLVIYFAKTSSSAKNPVSSDNDITVSGTFVCLPHKDSGIATEECAYGLKSDDGKYYALGNSDSIFDYFQSGKKARVTGVFERKQDSRYKDIGLIVIKSVDSTE